MLWDEENFSNAVLLLFLCIQTREDAFPVLLPSLSGSPREREVAEFRSLLQTVLQCLKSVLYCMVAFHTNRGLQAPVRFCAQWQWNGVQWQHGLQMRSLRDSVQIWEHTTLCPATPRIPRSCLFL